jgi:hypothetical protein
LPVKLLFLVTFCKSDTLLEIYVVADIKPTSAFTVEKFPTSANEKGTNTPSIEMQTKN